MQSHSSHLAWFRKETPDVELASWTLSVQKMHKSVQKMYSFCTVGNCALSIQLVEGGLKRTTFIGCVHEMNKADESCNVWKVFLAAAAN